MKHSKFLFFCMVLSTLVLSSCSGLSDVPGGGGNTGGGGNGSGTGSVSLTLVADTPPANPSILSFTVSISSLVLNQASGTSNTITLNPPVVVDLVRLQSDSAFLGTFANVPSGTYTSVTAVLGIPAQMTFLNNSGATITSLTPNCPNGAVCQASVVATGSPQATVAFTVPTTGAVGVGLDLNLSNAVSITSGSLNVVFSNANLLTAFTLPRTGSNLPSGQLDLIEDFTGVVTLGGSGVTITPAAVTGRGPLLASTNSTMILNANPSGTLCTTPTQGSITSCLQNNQVASVDAVLKSDGTLTIQEIEPLLGTLQDTVEGTIISVSSPVQFQLVATDLLPAATNSLIGGLHIGDFLTVNLAVNPNPFLVDSKGLPAGIVDPATIGIFQGATDTTPLRPGQTVSVHINTFSSTTTPPSSTTDTVTLRWTRFTATPSAPFSQGTFDLSTLPSFFSPSSGLFVVQAFPGAPTTQNVTNFDGITDASQINLAKSVGVRAQFFENSTSSASPAFIAAKVRQH